MPKLKKGDLVTLLLGSLSEEQWTLINQLHGKPIKSTGKTRENFLWGLFTKARSHGQAKAIGRNLQQWVCQKISEAVGLPWGKDEDIASREGGQAGCDVRLSHRARALFPFSIECKSGDREKIPDSAIKQAQANMYENTDWMVVLDRPHVIKERRIPPIIIVDGEVFFRIWRQACQNKK